MWWLYVVLFRVVERVDVSHECMEFLPVRLFHHLAHHLTDVKILLWNLFLASCWVNDAVNCLREESPESVQITRVAFSEDWNFCKVLLFIAPLFNWNEVPFVLLDGDLNPTWVVIDVFQLLGLSLLGFSLFGLCLLGFNLFWLCLSRFSLFGFSLLVLFRGFFSVDWLLSFLAEDFRVVGILVLNQSFDGCLFSLVLYLTQQHDDNDRKESDNEPRQAIVGDVSCLLSWLLRNHSPLDFLSFRWINYVS